MSKDSNPFNILGSESTPVNQGESVQETKTENPLDERIKDLIGSSDVFLFMKGVPEYPQCGFSANVVGLLNHLQVSFKTFDILSDQEIREGVKQYSNWPTYPQLYVKSELVGGNDIIMEMYQSGDLENVLKASS